MTVDVAVIVLFPNLAKQKVSNPMLVTNIWGKFLLLYEDLVWESLLSSWPQKIKITFKFILNKYTFPYFTLHVHMITIQKKVGKE